MTRTSITLPPLLNFLAAHPLTLVLTSVATAPKLVVAPAALTSTLLVTPPTTASDVVKPFGTPVEVTITIPEFPKLVPVAFVAETDPVPATEAEIVEETDGEKEEEETPLQEPEIHVLKAHCSSEEQLAPKFPQCGTSIAFPA